MNFMLSARSDVGLEKRICDGESTCNEEETGLAARVLSIYVQGRPLERVEACPNLVYHSIWMENGVAMQIVF